MRLVAGWGVAFAAAIALSACAASQPAPAAPIGDNAARQAPTSPATVPPGDQVPGASAAADRIYFDDGTTDVDESSMKLLLANVARLKSDPRLVVTLIAHAEQSGSRSYTLAVAQELVDTVTGLLRSFGVPIRQIRHRGEGRRSAATACDEHRCGPEARFVGLVYE